MSLSEDLQTVESIAREAGDVILKHFRRVERLTKTHAVASNEAVTEADRESQRFIVGELRKRFPATDGVIGEESDDGSSITLDVRDPNGRNWVIDPIDGTNNFIAGLTGFCVCIGLIDGGLPVLGVVYDVLADKLYSGAKGVGAFACESNAPRRGESREGEAPAELGRTAGPVTFDDRGSAGASPSRSSPLTCREGGMTESAILCMTANLVGKDGRVPTWASMLLGQITWKVRVLGSAALEAVLVADGVAGAAIQVNTKLWDIAAAAAIVLEAGGVITDLAGKPIFPIDLRSYSGQKIPYVAGTRGAHADVLDYIVRNP